MRADAAPTARALPAGSLVVVGQDDLGIEVCRRLVAANRRVVAVWPAQVVPHLEDLKRLDVEWIVGDARRAEVLARAGVQSAETVLAITKDDELNLLIALAARDLNPGIRVVLRQFNRRLGQKIAHQLPNCDAVSPETYSAATFAASCLNRTVYHALEFPRYSERLVAFCRGSADELGVAGMPAGEIEQRRGWRVLAIDETRFPPAAAVAGSSAQLTIACQLDRAPHAPHVIHEHEAGGALPFGQDTGLWNRLRRAHLDPVLTSLVALLLIVLAFSTVYFAGELRLTPMDAFYFVISTVTTTGFGDINLKDASTFGKAVGILLMLVGVIVTGVLLAYLTAAITRRSLEFSRGLYPMKGKDHVVVCGFGNVGSRIVSYLLHDGRRVAVIDRNPNPALMSEARLRGAQVITADATSESALDLAGVTRSAALLAVTDSDSANFEIALTALAGAPQLPVVVRIAEHATAKSIERHFRIRASYSAAELAAPLVTGLAIERGSRGTIDVAGQRFTLMQRARTSGPASGDELLLAEHEEWALVLRKS